MRNRLNKYFFVFYLFGDFVYLYGVLLFSLKIIHGTPIFGYISDNWSFVLFYGLSWVLLSYFIRIYEIYRYTRISFILNNIFKILIVHFTFITTYISLEGGGIFSVKTLFIIYGVLFLVMPTWRLAALTFLKSYRKSGFNFRNVVILGQSKLSVELKEYFENHPEHGYRFLGFYSESPLTDLIEGDLNLLKKHIKQNRIDEVYLSLSEYTSETVSELINFCRNNLVSIKFIPHAEGLNYTKIKVEFYDLMPVIELQQTPLHDTINSFIKRSFDLAFSTIVIVCFLSWMVPLFGLIIKISSKGPVFFKQKRSGLNNESFWCYKFRSMAVNQESDNLQATKGDVRVTRIGAFLRKTSLDEMPQFFNVFSGSMSVVGPRPHMIRHTELYSEQIEEYLVRHFVKPGITGLSQVMGYRGETRELRLMKNRVKMDIFYIEHWSMWLDLKIIFLTIANGMKGDKNVF